MKEKLKEYICFDCGQKYLSPAQKRIKMVVTCHQNTCDECEEIKTVTHIRHFNYGRIK